MAAAILPVAFVTFFMLGGWNRQTKQPTYNLSSGATAESSSIETMKSALAWDRKLLAGYERDQSALRAEVIRRRQLFQDGQISKDQVLEVERSFVAALTRVHAMRDSVTETDIAITEAVLGEKVLRMPVLPVNGYSETAELARFNGGFKWSLKEASRIERFFSQSFGRGLPIAAKGQSETHNRFGFDHRNAMDVALHPDSAEGKALIKELRSAGIPFIAFRSAVPGASTGPHIHIGKPSTRLAR
ncbi:MAG TPA: hypothetical protein VEQ38_05295 [Verrucomicrobiae bacterium]|nr:hypothetical protein [Verrucomicrobiae bacterium]